jgi:hypothetical protein
MAISAAEKRPFRKIKTRIASRVGKKSKASDITAGVYPLRT